MGFVEKRFGVFTLVKLMKKKQEGHSPIKILPSRFKLFETTYRLDFNSPYIFTIAAEKGSAGMEMDLAYQGVFIS